MTKLSPRDETIVEIVIVIVIAVALAMLLVRPQLGRLSELDAQRQAEEQSIRNAQAELELLKAAKGEALQVQADLIKVGNEVPDTPQLPSIVVQLQDLANEAGINFVQIKPGTLAPAGEYTVLPLQLSLRGQFFDIVDFLYRIEHLPREVRVSDVDLAGAGVQASGSEEGGQSLELKITANVFVMGSVGQQPGSVPAPPSSSAPSGG